MKTETDYFNEGLAKHAKEDNKGAIEDFNKAIELNPKYFDAYYNRAIARQALKDYIGAIEDYPKLL